MNILSNTYRKQGFEVKEKNDSLLISFKDSSKTDIIVRFDNSSTPLSFEKVKVHYEHFFILGKKVNCFQYRLICPGGFDQECEFFSQVNIALSGQEYLDSLSNINHIELFAHNDIAYSKLISQLNVADKACVIQPTGTGKSLILAKFISDRPNSNFVYLSPSKFIFKEVNKHLINSNNIKFITFHKLINLTVKEIQHLNPDFIIVDEFHRCGGEEWGSGVELLLKTYPDAKLLGTTATHIRYLDDKRNMADEMFDGNIAHHLTLSKALALGILPTPKYISALYKFDEEYLRVKKSIASSLAEDKKILLERLNKVKLEFENTRSIPNILQQHISGDIQKIIVFTKDIKHLRKHKPMVLKWFYSLGYNNIKVYEVYSENELKNKDVFKAFEEQNEGLGIIFSVNMLNEGIHVKGVNCIIMLRDTESPIIYYQQMGRCLTVGADKPLIFDLVNNFANIRHRNLENEVFNESLKISELYKSKGFQYQEINFEIIDKVRDIKDLLNSIESTADNWTYFINRLLEFKSTHKHCKVSGRYICPDGYNLGNRCNKIRIRVKNNNYPPERIEKLKSIGFFDNIKIDKHWELFLSELLNFKYIFNHCKVPLKYVSPNGYKLGVRTHDIRSQNLSLEKKEILNSIGFVWNTFDASWSNFVVEIKKYFDIHGHFNVPKGYRTNEFDLHYKCGHAKRNYKHGKLSKETVDQLKTIGFLR